VNTCAISFAAEIIGFAGEICELNQKQLQVCVFMCMIVTRLHFKRETVAEKLTRLEQQVMDVVFAGAPCTAQEVQAKIGGSYSASRAILSRMVAKGLLKQQHDGPRYLFSPARNLTSQRKSAMKEMVASLFGGSSSDAMNTLLALSKNTIDVEELDRLEALIQTARNDSRKAK